MKKAFLGLLIGIRAYGAQWFPIQLESAIYPLLGVQAQITGTVHLRVLLDHSGGVTSAEVISGNAILGRTARENIKLWRFAVIPTDSQEVVWSLDFTYEFRLRGDVQIRPRTSFRYEHPYRVILTSEGAHWVPEARSGPP